MAYIGKEPIVGNFQKCDAITVVNGQAAYTLQAGGVNVVPESSFHIICSLNGVIQNPGTSFSVSSSTLTFASNLATGDVIDFVILLGSVLSVCTPSDATVTNAKLAQDIISGETDIGGAIADADLFLLDDGAGGTLRKTAASRIKTYVGGGISAADTWRLTTNFTDLANPIASNWEQTDTGGQSALGSSMSQSSGIFTFPSTGFWLVQFAAKHVNSSDADYHKDHIEVTTDNSSYAAVTELWGNLEPGEYNTTFGMAIIDVTNTTNVKVRFCVAAADQAANMTTYGDTNINATYTTFIRLGDT